LITILNVFSVLLLISPKPLIG